VSTLLLVATLLLLVAAYRIEAGKLASAAAPAGLGFLILLGPFLLGGAGGGGEAVLNLYIWSNYIAPETIAKFEARQGVRVNVDLYDSNEALLAKLQGGNTAYDVVCPSNYPIEILLKQGLLQRLDHEALPHLRNVDPRFLNRAHDPGNRYSAPYFWGTTGIAYSKKRVGRLDSWGALWDQRYRGRILMLDDPRETFGAALKWKGFSLNERDPVRLREAQELLLLQKPLVKTYNSSSFEDVLLSGDVWVAQGWNGQFAKVIAQDPDLEYVIPKEGSALFLDGLAIPVSAPHVRLAHAFIDFVLEADIAAEICRTMQYSTPNRAALVLLPPQIRSNPAIFPPGDVLSRLELMTDLGETTLLNYRLWTEVKASR